MKLTTGEKLFIHRNRSGMTQKQLAAALGTTHARISLIESGKAELRASEIAVMTQLFGCCAGDILTDKED